MDNLKYENHSTAKILERSNEVHTQCILASTKQKLSPPQ